MNETLGERELRLLFRALAFAAGKHRDQRRKDRAGAPYINHPIALASILVDEAGVTDVATLCAALLHDTLEDTSTTPDELALEFGPEVRDLVLEVTDDRTLARPERKRRQVEHAPQLSPKARLIKLADKIANLRDVAASPPQGWDELRRQGYFDWAREVIDGLRGMHPGLEAVFDETYRAGP